MNKTLIITTLIGASVTGSAVLADRDHGFGSWFGRGENHGPADMDGQMGAGPGGLLGGLMPDFAALDADANGQITAEELDAARAARFSSADGNTDGGLSADEIVAQLAARRAEMMAARAVRMIQEQDANADGLLQADELADGRGPSPAVIFAMLDTNTDGTVDRAEFDAGLAALADRAGRHNRS